MYKNEHEWLEAVQKDDLTATVEMLQKTRLPNVPPSSQLSQIRRELLTKRATRQQWLPLLRRGAGALVSLSLLVLLVGYFWMNQANQATSSLEEPENVANPADEVEQEATAVPTLTPEVTAEARETAVPTPTAVIPTDQVSWLAVRRQLTDRNTNLTPYEIEVGYDLETVDTAVAQVFLAPQNWETAVDMYPFSEPVTISADDDNVTFTIPKDLDQFFQDIPPRVNSLVIALSSPGAEPDEIFLATAAWKNFVDTEYFAGPIFIAPASDSALNVFDWEFDNNFFAVESPSRRFGGTEIVTFVVNYHYQLTQTSRAYVKLVLVDKTHGNRRLDSAFVRADAGVGLVTAYLEFDPAQVDGSTDLAIESFVVREGLESLSPDGTAGGWRYVP
jgi:hypothetical protein